MSVPTEKNVRRLVEKYRSQLPELERPLLRRLIRSENRITDPSELKKLDRYLKKAFQSMVKNQTMKASGFDSYEQYRNKLEQIGNIGLISPNLGIGRLCIFIASLEPSLKDRINSALLPIWENKTYNDSLALKIALDKISTILYESCNM
jgi:hypothetical protein